MDDFFTIILFLVFILAPLIDQMRKKGKQPPAPPPGERTQQPLPRSTTEEVSSGSREQAAVLVPDDLWEVLTGERRTPQTQAPAPLPERVKPPWDVVYVPPEETDDEEDYEVPALEDVDVEVTRAERTHERWHRAPVAVTLEEEPVIVSLETEPLSSTARHTQFHAKLTREEAARPVKPKPILFELGGRRELRRAFVLQEVLGRPRGLD